MAALLQREMKKRRIGCELGRTLKDLRVEGGTVKAVLGPSPFIAEPTPAQSKEAPIEAEAVLVTVGRAQHLGPRSGRSRDRRRRARLDSGR